MSEGNGVMRLSVPEGRVKVQLGSGPVQAIDVVATCQRWYELCRDEKADGEDITLRSEKLVEEVGLGKEHNRAEALLFTKTLDELAEPLRKKVVGRGGDKEPSSPPSTGSTVSESAPEKS